MKPINALGGGPPDRRDLIVDHEATSSDHEITTLRIDEWELRQRWEKCVKHPDARQHRIIGGTEFDNFTTYICDMAFECREKLRATSNSVVTTLSGMEIKTSDGGAKSGFASDIDFERTHMMTFPIIREGKKINAKQTFMRNNNVGALVKGTFSIRSNAHPGLRYSRDYHSFNADGKWPDKDNMIKHLKEECQHLAIGDVVEWVFPEWDLNATLADGDAVCEYMDPTSEKYWDVVKHMYPRIMQKSMRIIPHLRRVPEHQIMFDEKYSLMLSQLINGDATPLRETRTKGMLQQLSDALKRARRPKAKVIDGNEFGEAVTLTLMQ